MMATDQKTKTPEGWQKQNLKLLCTKIAMGETLIADQLTGEGVAVFSANTDNKPWGFTSKNKFLYPIGTIIIGARGSIGFPRLPKEKKYTSTQTTIAVFPKIDSKYLFYCLNKINFSDIADQQAVPMLTVESAENLLFCFPADLKEQQTIASVLSTIDEAIERTESIIAKNKRIKQGLMQDLFRYGIDENGNIRDEKTHKFQDSPLGRIPQEWEVAELKKISSLITNGFVGVVTPWYTQEEPNILYLRGLNVRENRIVLDDVVFVKPEFNKRFKKSVLRAGDMLTVQSGHVGTSGVVDKENQNANCHALIITRFNNKNVIPEFISYFINSHIGYRKLIDFFIGSTIQHINTSQFKYFRVPLPPKPEQLRITSMLSQIQMTIEKEERYKRKLLAIKRGLMEDLLSGSVRVTHLIGKN